MTFPTAKLTELPLRSSLPLPSSSSYVLKPPFRIFRMPFFLSPTSNCSSSLRTDDKNPNPSSSSPTNAPWLSKWPPPQYNATTDNSPVPKRISQPSARGGGRETPRAAYVVKDKGQSAIERIVLRLRNLGLAEEEGGEGGEESEVGAGDCPKNAPLTGEERLGDLLEREWVRPDAFLLAGDDDGGDEEDDVLLPWEREERRGNEGERREWEEGKKRRVARAPTLAELTIEDEELRRLRRNGMFVRERVSIPKAGLTREVMQKIHDKWRKEELVRLKFHEVLAHDMKTAHELVERRTGGLVIWRSGSVMLVFRGHNYQGPNMKSQDNVAREGTAPFVPDVSLTDVVMLRSGDGGGIFEVATSMVVKSEIAVKRADCAENMTEEEIEYNSILDGLGPRFEEWWGTGVLPVDADLLPQKVPDYKTPFRLLPTGMRSRLTNAEMTNLRKIAKSLPCHFALGRNRNHQGLAAAILKLWEKSLIVKIAVKRGIQNTNNKLMADELKALTGGVLLLRNKYFIVMYRGKDFLPTTVATALAERNEQTNQIQDIEDKLRGRVVTTLYQEEGKVLAGTLAEFYEAQSQWGRDISAEEREQMFEEASRAKHARLVKRIEHKLAVAQAKKLRAERLLAKIESSMIPAGPDYDQETITDEERAMFRRVGLRMKAYLPLGIRGVFDGVIENMHLHWKHRELVKLISKQKTLAFVEDSARLLEYESGGILVAIERVPKGFALIYYRGKNYQRPISIRPRNLLTKAKALKRSVAMQRHEALSQHISELERTIDQMKKQIGLSDGDDDCNWSSQEHDLLKHASELRQGDDAASYLRSEEEEEEDSDYDEDENEVDKDDDHEIHEDIDCEVDKDFEFSS